MIFTIRKVLRLYKRQQILTTKRYLNNFEITNDTVDNNGHNNFKKDFNELLEKYRGKISFNSLLDRERLELGSYGYFKKTVKEAKKAAINEYTSKSSPPLPISLKYYVHEDRLLKSENETQVVELEEKNFQLPFANTTKVQINTDENLLQEQENGQDFERSNIKKWMTNYEYFDDTRLQDLDEESDNDDTFEWSKDYGTPDPSVKVSRVPCGGCGALLHCNDPAIPGYLPSEIFINRTDTELKTLECQRCHFLKEYNIALDVSVQHEEYEKLLQSIKYVKSMVLLMVDLLDFPCSIWPDIVNIIGTQRPMILVGNKLDLLPGDSVGYVKRVREALMTEVNKTKLKEANIKHVALISAKTGYGVEELISAMFKTWYGKGDVFLVGCTNVGKSSLFNALLRSDYCKVHAVDIVKRATVSRWPGTTLNLLKFPINRPSGWKIYERNKRLKSNAKLLAFENEIRNAQLSGKMKSLPPTLIGHIGRSFSEFNPLKSTDAAVLESRKFLVLNEKHELFRDSKWFYDTPGVVHTDQVLSMLTTEELLLTIPREIIRPRTFYLLKGATMFVGGLARVDLIDAEESCRFTVFCAESLPITVTGVEHADEIYDLFLGTDLFAAPAGGKERMANWPGLQKSEDTLEFRGEGAKMCCGDVVLSSVAWVAISTKNGSRCTVAAWTPMAKGVHKRYPSVLPYSVNLKGKRIQGTPAYGVGKVFKEET